MKNRILKKLHHLIWKYTMTTKKISSLEAKRYCEYITSNYDETEQLFILKDLHKHLTEHRENQIKNTEVEILQQKDKLEILNKNLEKINNVL